MRNALLTLAIAACVAHGTQWSPRKQAGGLMTAGRDYAATILNDGSAYVFKWPVGLYYVPYKGGYVWDGSQRTQCTCPDCIRCFTGDPTFKVALVVDRSFNLRWATTADKVAWEWGDILGAWDRSPQYPVSVSCAWRSPGKELLVVYDDGLSFIGVYPYETLQPVDLDPGGDGHVCSAAIRQTGDYVVVSDRSGTYTNLYELWGRGTYWANRTIIGEVNSGQDDDRPVLATLDGSNLLLWSAAYPNFDFIIWYSTGEENFAVAPASLGKVKALFQ